jgi:hypothetical protein
MGFYPDVAPVTVAHILKLARLGAYNTNHFFRVRPSKEREREEWRVSVSSSRASTHRPRGTGARLPCRHINNQSCSQCALPTIGRTPPKTLLAPTTASHAAMRLGGRQVDKGFVAQVADVMGGRLAPMDALQRFVRAHFNTSVAFP